MWQYQILITTTASFETNVAYYEKCHSHEYEFWIVIVERSLQFNPVDKSIEYFIAVYCSVYFINIVHSDFNN